MPSDRFYPNRRSSCDSSSSESLSTEPIEISTPSTVFFPSPSSPTTPKPTTQAMPPTITRSKKRKFHADFEKTLHKMATPLMSFVSIETGHPHPDFPRNHLSFHLLTSNQLDALARHYHQVWPSQPATSCYPFQIRSWIGAPDQSYVDINTKRRRFGFFIGMPGYGDPVNSGLERPWLSSLEIIPSFGPESTDDEDEDCYGYGYHDEEVKEDDGDYEMSENEEICVLEEEVLEWMAREWEAALREASDQSRGPFRKY